MKKYTRRVLIGLDQFINTLFGGYPNETLSARAWRRSMVDQNAYWNTFRIFVDTLFKPIERNHCEKSYLYFKTVTKTCGIYYPIYSDVNVHNTTLPIDLPAFDYYIE